MDKISVISIAIAMISCLISVFTYLNSRNKEYVDKIDAWSNNFNNKLNKLLEFSGVNTVLTFKYEFSNTMVLKFNKKEDSEQYNEYVKKLVERKDKLTSAYQEAVSIVNISFNQKNQNQEMIGNLVGELFRKTDNHFSNILTLNDIREKYFCELMSEKEINSFLEKMFNNAKEVVLLHSIIEKLKTNTVNTINLNMINNRNIMGFSTKKLLSMMVAHLDSFDEFKYYKSKDINELSENFKKWNADVDREIELCKNEILNNLQFGKNEFQRSLDETYNIQRKTRVSR